MLKSSKTYPLILGGTVALLLLPLALSLAGIIPHFHRVEIHFHSTAEATGAIISLLIAALIFKRFHRDPEELDYPFVGLGFLGMGIFDLYHSFLTPGDAFVFSHMFSILMGGFCFGLIVLPRKIRYWVRKKSVFSIILLCWASLLLFMTFLPDYLPEMVHEGHFTLFTLIMNSLAGLGFFSGSIGLIQRFLKSGDRDIFLIAIVGIYQGASRIIFHWSTPWDLEWWIWHLFRFAGSGIVFYAVIMTFNKFINSLRNTSTNLQAIMDAMPFGLMVVGSDKKIRQINLSALEITGYSKEDTLRKHCYDSVCIADCHSCPVFDLGLELHNVEKIMKRKGGDTFPVIKTAVPVEQNGERLLLEGFVDITRMKEAEAEKNKAEERLKLATQVGKIGIWDWNVKNDTLIWDDSMYQLFDVRKEDFTGAYDAWRDTLHPGDLEFAEQEINEVLKGKGDLDFEFRIVTRTGEIRYIHSTGAAYMGEDGKASRLLGVNYDVTESIRQQKELVSTLAELKQSNRELEQFAYVSSHDLKEPLRKMKNYAELLELRYKDKLDERGKKYINSIVHGSDRVKALIEDLLIMSRINSQGKTVEKLDVGLTITGVLSDLKEEIKENRALIECGKMPSIMADADLMALVFHHLVHNAIKFRNNEDPLVQISSEDKKSYWLFSVSDNGIGLDMQYADRIFVVFQRLHKQQSYSGTGIGLSICKKIVELHGGKIWVESGPGSGACFRFTIPKEEN